jgi:hypothetical protein
MIASMFLKLMEESQKNNSSKPFAEEQPSLKKDKAKTEVSQKLESGTSAKKQRNGPRTDHHNFSERIKD